MFKMYELLNPDSSIDIDRYKPQPRPVNKRQVGNEEEKPEGSYCPWGVGKIYMPRSNNRKGRVKDGKSENS